MIRQLSQCPYCQQGEIALDDHPEVVFNPDGPRPGPCPHLVWVDGRYSQWDLDAHGFNRMIGSTEFRWDHPALAGVEGELPLTDYLRELAGSGPGWDFAPAQPFHARPISADQKKTDRKGKPHPVWEVDGAALFAQNPPAFVAELPACRDRQLAGLKVKPEDEQPS
jgi:hypothetical protein